MRARILSRLFSPFFQSDYFFHQIHLNKSAASASPQLKGSKSPFHYKSLYPWQSPEELAKHLAASLAYNNDGLIALNKPYGVRIYKENSSGAPPKSQRLIVPAIPDCDLTIEDTLEPLKEFLKVSELNILKSAERYASGLVLLSTNKKTSAAVKRSLYIAKSLKKPHLVHWFITLEYPVVRFRKEKVGIYLQGSEEEQKLNNSQYTEVAENGPLPPRIACPVIVTKVSKRSIKLKKLHPVFVESKVIFVNERLSSSLVEVSASSVKHHFVRVYASSRLAGILGDCLYSSRMSTLMGVPVNVRVQQGSAFDLPPLPEKLAQCLELPKGVEGHSLVPTLLHLRSYFLPSFKGSDVTITADLPPHFRWAAQRLNLLSNDFT